MNASSASTPYARGEASTAPPVRVAMEELHEHGTAVLEATGLSEASSRLVADSLVDAEVRGIPSHGITRVRIYAERMRAGLIDVAAVPEVLRRDPGSAHIDAHNAIGHVGANAGLQLAIDSAENELVSVVGVANSNHCGTLAYFTRRAAEAGLVAIAMSTAPQTMVYFGGRTRAVGTNPISIAVPRPDGGSIVVDMATSATARGKIILANKLGHPIPEGWAVDADGKPTTDAAAALLGSVTPFGGPKGSGLAMMVDLIAGAMVAGVSGADIGDMYEDYTRPQRVSHLFMVLNPDGWFGREAFLQHVGQFAERVHSLPTAEGVDRVLLPGDLEEARWQRARAEGVEVAAAVIDDLDAIATEVGIDRRVSFMAG